MSVAMPAAEPERVTEILSSWARAEEPTTGAIPKRWREGGYLERVPRDAWENDFLYASDGRTYVLRSLGADGEEGGEDVNADIDSRDF